MQESSIFILVLTPDAVSSSWVQRETNAAIGLEHRGEMRLVPLDLKPTQVPPLWQTYQYISFRSRYEDGLQALLTILQPETQGTLATLYEKAIESLDKQAWASAKAKFEQILQRTINYRDVEDKLQEVNKKLESKLPIADVQTFFRTAGFKIEQTAKPDIFLCIPAKSTWRRKLSGPIYTIFWTDKALEGDDVLSIRQTARAFSEGVEFSFVLVNQAIMDSAWLQIAALRPLHFNVIPIPVTLPYESSLSQKSQPSLVLEKHLIRYVGHNYDPYDVRNPVSNVLNFFGREAISRQLIERLITGKPVGLFGLRKIGKSSLLQYMRSQMPCPTALIDLQGGTRPEDLFGRILRLWQQDAQIKLDIDIKLNNRELDPNNPADSFFNLTQEILGLLSKYEADARLAIFLDEIELLTPQYNSQDSCVPILHTLRGLVQEDGRLSLMVAGVDPSINRVSRWNENQQQNPFFQLLQEFFLPPLLEEDCVVMIRNIGQQVEIEYDDFAINRIAKLSGGHPFIARQLCSLIYESRQRERGTVALKEVTESASRFLYDPRYASILNENGLWGEISNISLWGTGLAESNKTLILSFAESSTPIKKSAIINQEKGEIFLSSLFALEQLSVIKKIDDSVDSFSITFELFRSWIRNVKLGRNE